MKDQGLDIVEGSALSGVGNQELDVVKGLVPPRQKKTYSKL
jgi:hypothetical protein